MAKIELHSDFKDFLRLLNSHGVEYLLVGGYAVGYHGYPRATGDMDIWIAVSESNANAVAAAFTEFGMTDSRVTKELFLKKNIIVRMGIPPVRIEVITGASGVVFEQCYERAETIDIDDVPIKMISLPDLKINAPAAATRTSMTSSTFRRKQQNSLFPVHLNAKTHVFFSRFRRAPFRRHVAEGFQLPDQYRGAFGADLERYGAAGAG